MASVRRTKQGRWQVRWRQDGREPSETFDRERDAIRFRGLVDAAGQRFPDGWVPGHGFAQRTETPTLAEWFQRSLDARHRANEKTKADYRRDFDRHVPPWLASKPVDLITHEDVGRWLGSLAAARSRGRPLSPKTIKNIHGVVSSALRDAQRDGLINRNPFSGALRGSSTSSFEQTFLTPEEFETLNEYMPAHYRDFMVLLFHTGLRLGEAVALQAPAVDLKRRQLAVTQAWKRGGYVGEPKSARSRRRIAISDRICELLEPRLRQEWLFLNQNGGQVRPNSLHSHTWSPALASARRHGFPKQPRIHDLRHSHAAYLLSRNVPILAVSRRLGHASIQVTTSVYGHLLPEVDAAIIAAMDDLG